MSSSSQQRIILVTGSNKGIGLEIVRDLAISNKNSIIIGTARQKEIAEKTVLDLKQENGITNVRFEVLDVKNSESIDQLTRRIAEQFGYLDVVVHNAAVVHPNLEITIDGTDDQLRTNVYGLIELTEKLFPLLKKSNDSRIVIVGSRGGNLENFSKSLQNEYLNAKSTRDIFELAYAFEGAARHNDHERIGYPKPFFANTAYKASKALVHTYGYVLSLEHPEILTTSFCPGAIVTDMTKSLDTFEMMTNHGTPKQGADTGVWLVNSERKDLTNGQFYVKRTAYSRISNTPF